MGLSRYVETDPAPWRREKESNPRVLPRPGFRDRLPTTEHFPPYVDSGGIEPPAKTLQRSLDTLSLPPWGTRRELNPRHSTHNRVLYR